MKQVLAEIKRQRAIPILRTDTAVQAGIAAVELIRAGLNLIEITMTFAEAADSIRKLAAQPGTIVGAGTVLNVQHLREIIELGARFAVSPHLDFEMIDYALQQNFLYIPGCATVTEMMNATNRGALAVKVFPISSLGGPGFVKSVLAPLPLLNMIPTGGVTIDNSKDYLNAGAFAVGLTGMIDKEAIKQGKSGNTFARSLNLLNSIREPKH